MSNVRQVMRDPTRLVLVVLACLAVCATAWFGYRVIVANNAYPLFHLFAEFVTVVVGVAAFAIAWNARDGIDNGYLLVVAVALVCSAGLDTFHAVTYRGVGLLQSPDTNLPTQLWLAARYVQTLGLFTASFMIGHRVRPWLTLASFAGLTALLGSTILWWHVFPAAFVEGRGLTPFKVTSEYLVCLLLLVSLGMLIQGRDSFDHQTYRLFVCAVGLTVIAEVSFTLYASPFGAWNYLGHLVRIIAAICFYRALVEGAVTRPLDVLFRRVAQSSAALAESEARYRSTFEQATLGIMHVAPDGKIIVANHRLAEITGRSVAELETMYAEQLTHHGDHVTEMELGEALARGTLSEYRLEKRILRPDGTAVWVNAGRSPVRDERGVRYYTEILEDISSRRLAEKHLQRSRDLNAAVATIDRAINSTFEIDEIMARAVSEGASALGADSAVVMFWEDSRFVVRHAWHFPEEIIGEEFAGDDLPYLRETARYGVPLAVEDAYNDDRLNLPLMRRYAIRSVIVIPLEFRGEDLGTLYFNYHGQTHAFDEDEVDFVIKLSSALTLAIENSRLYTAEHRMVDALVSSLLSYDRRIPGIEVGTAYYSATSLSRIGGDFFDVFALADGRVGFVIGDVAGKGLEAASLTAIAKSTLRAFAYEWDDPVRVIEAANTALDRQLDESHFITVVYGTLDTRSGEMTVVCAGHPTPLVCDARGCAPRDIPSSPPLGVFPDTEFSQLTFTLEPMQRVIMFSDGLLDARHGTDFLGERRVRDVVASLGDASPETVARRLLETARAHSEGQPPDDITILAFRYTGATQ